jgi:CRP-like cAMP-binding protein
MLNPNFWLQDDLKSFESSFKRYAYSIEEFNKNTIICSPGRKTETLYYLLKGVVKASVTHVSGSEKIVGYHSPGTLFALDCLIENENSLVTITAVTDVQCYKVYNIALKNMIVEDKMFAIKISEYYCKVLRLMCFEASNQCFNDAMTKVANFLYLYHTSEQNKTAGYLNLTQDELSLVMNVSRVQVARVYQTLRKEGIIQNHRGKITIKDAGKLHSYCKFS